ncbi:hypothetical protein R3P38DRAFT_3095060 [Favolaschia claudopus]|uniref:F-box domain-containing protein n=1 Tax=Favolaschia claudopus TaxID=2862362 RepID=A0AAV9ZQD8_9AGAR
MHALDVAELLDSCINLIGGRDLSSTLLACALVSRSWVSPAQARLFRAPYATNPYFLRSDKNALRFCKTVTENSHLIALVRDLSLIFMDRLTPKVFEKLCRLDFPRLDSLTIHLREELPCFDAIQWFAGTVTLRSLTLDASCMYLLASASTTVEHLDIRCYEWLETATSSPSPPDVYLKSLRLSVLEVNRPVSAAASLKASALEPFGLSELRALSVDGRIPVPWDQLPKSLIEILDITPGKSDLSNLSPYTTLSTLRLKATYALVPAAEILATITSEHHIHTIVLYVQRGDPVPSGPRAIKTGWAEFDLAFSKLPTPHPAIEFQFDDSRPCLETLRTSLPMLVSRTGTELRVLPFDPYIDETDLWWQDQISKL